MAGATINTKNGNLGVQFLRRTASYISGAAGEYVRDAMPNLSTVSVEIKSSMTELFTDLKNTTQSVLPKARQLRTQANLRGIARWYLTKEGEFEDDDGEEAGMDFDIDTDSSGADIAEAEISEAEKSSNKISKAVVESSHQMAETQIETTANLLSSMDKQTAAIVSGFDKTNELLAKMTEILTKNTAVLVETTAAARIEGEDRDARKEMVGSGKFSLKDYQKIIRKNVQGDFQLAMLTSFLPMLFADDGAMIKDMLSARSLTKTAFNFGVNKLAPNLKRNMKAFDTAANETVMDMLIRLGENRDPTLTGRLSRLFGIDAGRRNVSTSRADLTPGATSFDTITREAIINTIPGYLRQILYHLGGQDLHYDYRSRTFKSQSEIHDEFREAAASTGTLNTATKAVQRKIGTDDFSRMLYDMMMTDLGSRASGGEARRRLISFLDPAKAKEYVFDTLLNGIDLSEADKKAAEKFSSNLSKAARGNGARDMHRQLTRQSVAREKRMSSYVENANAYEVDLSGVSDSKDDELRTIINSHGYERWNQNRRTSETETPNEDSASSASVSGLMPDALVGLHYTNKALYEILRKLYLGINVFVTGYRRGGRPYEPFSESILRPPGDYQPKPLKPNDNPGSGGSDDKKDEEGNPLLEDEESKISGESEPDKETEEEAPEKEKGKGGKFGRWAHKRGGALMNAMFKGDASQVREAFGLMVGDVAEYAADGMKKGASKINDAFGNITGFLQHKMFGTEYTYVTERDANGNPIKSKSIAKNEKGGIFGFLKGEISRMWGGVKDGSKKWFSSVAGYFDYGDDKDDDSDGKIKAARKRIIGASVGALAGAGIFGGPIAMIMGGIAGNALATSGLGKRLKKLFLGGDDKNGKHKKGVLEKAVHATVRPVQYQVEKTLNHVSGALKKGVIGPISDIGFAIKESMTRQTKSIFGKFLHKVFGGIFKGMGALGKVGARVVGSIASVLSGGLIGVGGLGARSVVSAGATLSGGLLGGIANAFADKETKKKLKERRKARSEEVKEEREKYKFLGGYRSWYKKKDEEADDRRKRFREATEEQTAESTSETAKNTAELVEEMRKQGLTEDEIKVKLAELHKEALTEGSLYTHDKGLHDRLDSIIELFRKSDHSGVGGIKKDADSDRDEYADQFVGATASLITTSGVSKEESTIAKKLIRNAGQPDANPDKMSTDFNRLIDLQEENVVEEKEEKQSFWSKLLGGLGSVMSFFTSPLGLAAVIGGLIALNLDNVKDAVSSLITTAADGIGNALSNFSTSFGDLLDDIMNRDKDGDGEGDGGDVGLSAINTLTSLGDVRVNSLLDYLNPLATLKHTKKNAAGEDITNYTATNARNQLMLENVKRYGANELLGTNLKTMGSKASRDMRAARLGEKALLTEDANAAAAEAQNLANQGKTRRSAAKTKEANKLYNEAATKESASFLEGHATIRTGVNVATSFGVGKLFGKVGGVLGEKAAEFFGASEETAEIVGNTAEAAVTVTATVGALRNKGLAGKAKQALVKMIDTVITKLIASPIGEKVGKTALAAELSALSNAVRAGVNSMKSSVEQKMVKLFGEETTKFLGEYASGGLVALALATAGAITGTTAVDQLFQIPPNSADGLMKFIAGALGAALTAIPYVGLVEIADLIIVPLFGKGLRQYVAQAAYSASSPENRERLQQLQAGIQSELSDYNDKYDTNLSLTAYNDMVNGGFVNKFLHGKTITNEDGTTSFDEAGNVNTTGGFLGLFGAKKAYATDVDGKVIKDAKTGKAVTAIDEYGYAKFADESKKTALDYLKDAGHGVASWVTGKTKYATDEDGNVKYDENGKAIVAGKQENLLDRINHKVGNLIGVEDWDENAWELEAEGVGGPVDELEEQVTGKKSGKSVNLMQIATKGMRIASSVMTNPLLGITQGLMEFSKARNLSGEDGKEIVDSDGNPIKQKGLADFVKSSIGKLMSGITGPLNEIDKGVKEWEKTESPWKDTKAGKWITEKASSVWSWFKNGLDSLAEASAGGVGGPWVPEDEDNGGSTTSAYSELKGEKIQQKKNELSPAEESPEREGGNPLNKDYKVTSPYGPRSYPHSGMHKGVDLVPNDSSGRASVMSRFKGTVTGVKSNVSDADHARKSGGQYIYDGNNPEGNMVTIQADDGTIIKNMHLRHGSIPGGIRPGTRVNVGDRIGEMGTTGWSTGPHLHYQLENSKGNPFDPMTSVSNGSISTMNDNGTQDASISSDGSYSDGNVSTFAESQDSSSSSGSVISIIKDAISEFAKKLGLDKILGLNGSEASVNDGTSSSSISQYSNYTGNCKSAQAFLEMVAAEIGTTESPANSNNVKYNTWFYGHSVSGKDYPWCMAFVQWCFAQADLALPYKTASCSGLWDYYNKNAPDKVFKSNPKPGDIVIFSGHTGIVEKASAGTITTIEGNTSSSSSGSQSNGGGVFRKERALGSTRMVIRGFIRAVDFEALEAATSNIMAGQIGEGAEEIWKYFRALGYSDKAISGILGCWTEESANKSKRVEWDYSNSFKEMLGYDRVLNDRAAMDAFTEKLFNVGYAGKKINRKAYRAEDGHLYPGIGLAQWTGPRAKALLDFARKNNLDWSSMSTQMAFLDTELNGSYSKVRSKLENASSPQDAASVFCTHFEGYSGDQTSRRNNASKLYSQYAGKFSTSTTEGTGGPDETSNIRLPSMDESTEGVGGPWVPEDNDKSTTSSISSSSNYAQHKNEQTRQKKQQRSSISSINRSSSTPKSSSSSSSRKSSSTPAASVVTPTSTDLQDITALLGQVIDKLQTIATNTGESSNLLGSLNEKDFVDKGLRDSIDAIGKAQRKTAASSSFRSHISASNTRTISHMARPV